MARRFPNEEAPTSDAQQVIENALNKMHGGKPPFQWIEEDGTSLIGCYAPLSYTPVVAQQFFEVAKTVYGDGTVKARNRELAILGLCSILDVPYVVYCHRPLGAKYGISNEQYEEGLAGNIPSGLTDEECMAYSLGRILTDLKGPLPDTTWHEAISKMDKAEVVGIVHTIAGYRWVSLLDHVNGENRRWEDHQS